MDHNDWGRYNRRRRQRERRPTEYGVEPPPVPPPSGPRACNRRQEGDEYACHCGLRWAANEERPKCPHNGAY